MRFYSIKNVLRLALLTVAVASSGAVSAQIALTAQEAVDYAMKNSVQVKNALLDLQIQKQTNREVTAAALPQINGNLNYTNYLDIPTSLLPGEFFGQPGTYIPVQFGVKHNLNYGIDIQQLLFDGQVFVGLQARRTTIDYTQKGLEVTKEQIKANVAKIYYQILAGRKKLATIDANIARFQKLYDDTREIFNNGFTEKLDIDKTEVTLTNLRTEKLKGENQLTVALQGLKLLMGMPAKEELILKDSLPEEKIMEIIADEGYEYTDRKEFQQIELLQKLNEYNIRRYKLTYIPTFSISGNFNRNAQRQSFTFFKSGEQWFNATYVGLKVSVPIFDGLARDARIKKAKYELQQTQNLRYNLQLQIDQEVQDAKVNLRTAIASMNYQKKNIELAEKVYNQTKLKFEQGLGSNLEITTAQSELETAQNNYYAALFDAIVARVDYRRATGKL
ncbi:MAG: TolC family protein [Chitinophagaceae bacterium]|nr:TolC family protein [Chitinophagaceae bacterium]